MGDSRIVPARALRGEMAVPGDKSISHRYAILSAIAQGTSEIENYSPAADCASTLCCVERLGARVQWEGSRVTIGGVGRDGFRAPGGPLDAGNSGTTMRLLAGVLAGQPFESILTGDDSLRRRPMRRIVDPLTRMGASIEAERGDFPPLRIQGGALEAIRYEMPIPSAQVKSCILLAGLYASGTTTVTEQVATRDHTELALAEFGSHIARTAGIATIAGPARLEAHNLAVPGDLSSAVFLIAAALLLPGSELRLLNVGLNPTRTAVLDFLNSMGASIRITGRRTLAGEPRGDIEVRSATLSGGVVSGPASARMIDELPMLAALGPFTERGITILDARELRVKETDRIAALVDSLRRMGARVESFPDGLIVTGRGGGPLHGAEIDPRGDHRIAMAFAVAGLAATGESVIQDADCVAVSFPGFFDLLDSLIER
ncbi:MAG TPA: 3-phosphoshikimate 1-carboxyvinyltransferase [Patescibacteria group bacterium]|nr:3-phosphoshikimate 1-carboxyvinyltransferase [Patescibacteria group bacterium]